MASPAKEGEFTDALPSDVDDSSVDLNQFDQGYMNVSEEEVYFPNAIDEEEDMTNDWIVNQNPDPEECPAYYTSFSGGASSEDIVCNNQLSANELHTASVIDPSYSSGFVQALCRSVRQADESFLANAVMQSNAQQPPFSSIKNDGVCASDCEQKTEQARHEQLLKDEDAPLNYRPVYPHEIELVEAEEIQRIAGSTFNGEDDNITGHGNWQHDLYDKEEAFMFDDDHGGKDFSSWLLYGSDGGIAAFKNVLSESTLGEKPQTTVSTHTEKSSNAKPMTLQLHDDSHSKSSKEHTVPGSGSQASRASLDENPNKSDIADDSGKEAEEHQSNAKPSSNLDPQQCNSSHDDPPREHSPLLLGNGSPFEAGSSFQDAIVCTSTPNNSTRHSVQLGNQQAANRNASPTKEIKQSKYFLHENHNA